MGFGAGNLHEAEVVFHCNKRYLLSGGFMAKKKATQQAVPDRYVFLAALVVVGVLYIVLAYVTGVKQTAVVLGEGWPF